jgi:hypothetical protein
MSGYRVNQSQNEPVVNEGTAIIDGGNALTDYLVQFDNGNASNTGQTNPVVLNFGGAT